MMDKPLLTVKVEDRNPAHTRIKVWNRGGLAGTLTINTSDAAVVIGRLLGRAGSLRVRDCRGDDHQAEASGGV